MPRVVGASNPTRQRGLGMSKYCTIEGGVVLDFRFEPREVGTKFMVAGFATRLDAAEYLLQVYRAFREKEIQTGTRWQERITTCVQ